jgi:hypothetical protein
MTRGNMAAVQNRAWLAPVLSIRPDPALLSLPLPAGDETNPPPPSNPNSQTEGDAVGKVG